MSKNARILWNVFHPDLARSRGNALLLEAVRDLSRVTVRDQYALYPDGRIDVEAEQALLREHDLLVFQHPFYWYSTPALMKEWQDRVLAYGFAYPPKLGRELHGKTWLSVVTTGGPDFSYQAGGYNNFSMSEFLRPMQQSAYLCGLHWLPPFVVHGVLPGDFDGIRATGNDALKARAQVLRTFAQDWDPAERHTMSPVVTPYGYTP